ncbi:NAD(P)-binding protein [Arcanobacterium hippocoleae]
MKHYDIAIAGSGLFGAVIAFEAAKLGKSVLVVERRDHIGGNCYTEKIADINVHKYGAHIFRTSDKEIWDYMHQFCEFNNFVNSPVANYHGELLNMPFNMNTYYQLWGVKTPAEAREKLPRNVFHARIRKISKNTSSRLPAKTSSKNWWKDTPKSNGECLVKNFPVGNAPDSAAFHIRQQLLPRPVSRDSNRRLHADF